MKLLPIFAAGALALSAAPAFAFGLGDVAGAATGILVDGKVIVGANYGTLGAGGELGYKLNDFFAVRGVHSTGLTYDSSFTYDGQDVDYSLGAQGSGLMVDYHPFGGGMRLSGGLWKTDIGADFGSVYTVSSQGESRDFTISGDLSLPSTAPSATIGWHGGLGDRITIGAEFGAIMTGGASLTTAIDGDYSGLTDSQRAEIESEVDARRTEFEDQVNEYTDYLNFYPVAQVGVTFRF